MSNTRHHAAAYGVYHEILVLAAGHAFRQIRQTVHSRIPRCDVRFIFQIISQRQGHRVVELSRSGQREGVVDKLGAVEDMNVGVIVVQLFGQRLPVVCVVVHPVET